LRSPELQAEWPQHYRKKAHNVFCWIAEADFREIKRFDQLRGSLVKWAKTGIPVMMKIIFTVANLSAVGVFPLGRRRGPSASGREQLVHAP